MDGALLSFHESLLGGAVHFAYSVLDRLFEGVDFDLSGGAVNRKALIFSVIILLSIGVFKLLIMLFSGDGERENVRLKIKVGEKSVETEAMVDTGNMVRDPMSMCPVIFIKSSLASRLLPQSVMELCDIDSLDAEYKRRMRLIPVTRLGQTHVVAGFRADEVSVMRKDWEKGEFTLAIDKEGGTFGGYEALAPSAVIKNVL